MLLTLYLTLYLRVMGRVNPPGRIVDVWGGRSPYSDVWPIREDRECKEEPQEWVRSACVLCSVGCGLDIGVKDGRIVGVRGRPDDAVNRGRLGPKGLFGWQANGSEDRLLRPLLRKGGNLREVSWEEAMTVLVDRFRSVIENAGAGAVGFYNWGSCFSRSTTPSR